MSTPIGETELIATRSMRGTYIKLIASAVALVAAFDIALAFGTAPGSISIVAFAILVLGIGVVAGAIGAVIGFGTAMTLPVLFALGIPPLTASMSTTVGLVFGSIVAAIAFRPELAGQGSRTWRLSIAIGLGSIVGATVLLVLPASTFRYAAPVLIGGSLILVLCQDRISARLEHRHPDRPVGIGPVALLILGAVGITGGYYSGALGLIVLAALVALIPGDLRSLNAAKCVLVAVCNAVAAVEFLALSTVHRAHLDWLVIVLLAVGSIVGGLAGPWLSRRLSKSALRIVIVVISVAGLAIAIHSW